jgi:hypothetical protein
MPPVAIGLNFGSGSIRAFDWYWVGFGSEIGLNGRVWVERHRYRVCSALAWECREIGIQSRRLFEKIQFRSLEGTDTAGVTWNLMLKNVALGCLAIANEAAKELPALGVHRANDPVTNGEGKNCDR